MCPIQRHLSKSIAALTVATALLANPGLAHAQERGRAMLTAQAAAAFEVSSLQTFTLDKMFDLDEHIRQAIPYSGDNLEMVLWPYSNRAEDFQVFVQGDDGELQPIGPGPVTTYRGAVVDRPGSIVAVSVLEGRLEGTIKLDQGTELWFGSVADRVHGAPNNLYAIFDSKDRLEHAGVCGGGLIPPDMPPMVDAGARDEADEDRGGFIYTSRLALDADFEYFSDFGTTLLTQARMEAVVNTVNVQYESEVGIHHEITQVIIRTSAATQPYTATDSGDLLDQFRNWWQDNVSAPRSHAHLFTGKNLDGSTIGLAYVGVVCSNNFAYGLSEANFSTNFASITDLVAHELGHNWNAGHCSCSNPPYTMNPFIVSANTFNPTVTRPVITAFRDGPAWGCGFFSTRIQNDHCENAIPISDGLTPFSTIGATTDGFAHSSCPPNQVLGNDIWYTYTAPITGELLITTCEDLGGSANYDTDLAVYNRSGAPCPPTDAFLIACNDDDPNNPCGTGAGGWKSTIRTNVTAGQQLLIRVGGYSLTNEGTGQLLIRTAPANDDCSDALPINSQLTSFSTVGATTDGITHPSCQYGGVTGNDIWFTYTAPHAGRLTISTCEQEGGSANYDTDLVLYSAVGAPCPPTGAFLLDCNDDDLLNPCGTFAGGYKSTIRYDAAAGEQFLIRVGGFTEGVTGSGQLLVKVAPINDNCSDAIQISEGLTPFSTLGANTDGLAHSSCQYNGQTGNDIWFTYFPSCTGTVTITTCEQLGGSADYDTDLVLYSAGGGMPCPPTDPYLIACNDDDPNNPCGTFSGGYKSTIIAHVQAGQPYMIRVGGYVPGVEGTGNLLIQCGSGCPGDIDGNGVVDLNDLNLVLTNFGSGSGGDANGDGVTDLNDLNIVLTNFGNSC